MTRERKKSMDTVAQWHSGTMAMERERERGRERERERERERGKFYTLNY